MTMNKKIKLSDILTELQKMGKCCINEKLPIDADKLIELSIEGFDNVIHTLKQLSEPNKFKILLLLYKNGPLPVCVISYVLNLDQTLVSHHLKRLREMGLVEYERLNRFRFYKLAPTSKRLLDIIVNELGNK